MTQHNRVKKAEAYLHRLCLEIPNRCVGSVGNRQATAFVEKTMAAFDWEMKTAVFDCIDWTYSDVHLAAGKQIFPAQASPYSLAADVSAPLITVATVDELAACDCHGRILLLYGEIAKEPLMPKNFPFYKPEEHQKIISLLESKQPAVIITATSRNSELAGGMYPFPMLEDGDFDIPSAFMTAESGIKLAQFAGQEVRLAFTAERIPATGTNVIARKTGIETGTIIVFAHIDTKEGTPGALDNATGVVVLLLLAELLADWHTRFTTEIIALNGEDYYSTPGQIQFLADNQDHLDQIILGINLDGVGYHKGQTAYSLYGCPNKQESLIHQCFAAHDEMMVGEQWYQGDHAIFYQNQVPAVAITSEKIMQLTTEVTHTNKDVPALVDNDKLVRIALVLHDLVRALNGI